jgi:hypothetical protein
MSKQKFKGTFQNRRGKIRWYHSCKYLLASRKQVNAFFNPWIFELTVTSIVSEKCLFEFSHKSKKPYLYFLSFEYFCMWLILIWHRSYLSDVDVITHYLFSFKLYIFWKIYEHPNVTIMRTSPSDVTSGYNSRRKYPIWGLAANYFASPVEETSSRCHVFLHVSGPTVGLTSP